MGKDPQTESPWGMKDVPGDLVTKDIPTWLQPSTILLPHHQVFLQYGDRNTRY